VQGGHARRLTAFSSDGEYSSPFDPIPDGNGLTFNKDSNMAAETGTAPGVSSTTVSFAQI